MRQDNVPATKELGSQKLGKAVILRLVVNGVTDQVMYVPMENEQAGAARKVRFGKPSRPIRIEPWQLRRFAFRLGCIAYEVGSGVG